MISYFNRLVLSLRGSSRSAIAKRQVIYSFAIQGISVLIGLLYVPLLLNYLTKEKYGIWLTLTSVLGWFSFFDVGLGNGLRNKLTVAIAQGDFGLGKRLVSTTYALLICIFSVILIVFHIFNYYINWNEILNTKTIDPHELYVLTGIVFTFFMFRFIVQLISIVYLADQKPSVAKMMSTIGNLLSFFTVLILTWFTINGNLILLGSIISAVPVLVYIFFSLVSFNHRYKFLKPSITDIDFTLGRGLLNLGGKFFILQIAYIVVFSTSNIFIAQFYGPEEVAIYNVAFKYFQIPVMLFSIINSPIWSAVTDAYAKSDYLWLKKTLKELNSLSLLFSIGVIIMVLVSNQVYRIWVGDEISVPFSLSIALGIYTVLQIVILPYSSFINGMGKLKMTLFLTFIGFIVYPILIFSLKDYSDNSTGIVLAIIGTSLIGGVIQPIQTYKLLRTRAQGLWNQ